MESYAVEADVFEWLPTLDDDTAHAAVVDYPWEFDAQNGTGRFNSDGERTVDELAYDTTDHDRITDVFEAVESAVVDGGWVFIMCDDDTQREFEDAVDDVDGLHRRRTLIWDREHFAMGYYFRVQHYPIVTATVGDTERYVQDRGTVIRARKTSGGCGDVDYRFQEYPTSKPPSLYEQLLAEPVLTDGETLLEPFCGSSPGAAVAAKRGIGYIGVDANPEAVSIADERLSQTAADGGQACVDDF